VTRRRKTAQVYPLAEAEPGCHGVVRYSGDPDEFAALAHAWLVSERSGVFDYPVGIVAPDPKLYRMNPDPSGEFNWLLGEARRPGRGVWTGALLKVQQIGCSQCQVVGGAHRPGCLNEDVVALSTLQFGPGSQKRGSRHPLSPLTVHAVRFRRDRPGRLGGTPGPTLCDIDRFGPDAPGWSVGGGVSGPTMTFHACWLCHQVAVREFPGIPISGMRPLAEAFAGNGVPVARHLVREPTTNQKI
jgi:hypothetical protein